MITRKVLYAKLHTVVHLPSVGDLTATLPPTNKNFDLRMYTTTEGIELEVRGKTGRVHAALVPWGNVAVAELGQVEESMAPNVKAVKSSGGK